jgi:hypothetical protein
MRVDDRCRSHRRVDGDGRDSVQADRGSRNRFNHRGWLDRDRGGRRHRRLGRQVLLVFGRHVVQVLLDFVVRKDLVLKSTL